ncbi:MAG: hypothetical protein J0L65_07445 [Xanthomonadales bacterium]|nr:hypothetical protein [Xanthomonadales bacterium]
MVILSKMRRWANRDDGRLFQVGNEAISLVSLGGVFALVGALVIRDIQPFGEASSGWSAAVAVIGTGVLVLGMRALGRRRRSHSRTSD